MVKNNPSDDKSLKINDEALINDDKKSQDSINLNNFSDYKDNEPNSKNAENIVKKIDLNSIKDFIKIIDIDDLTPDELLRIIVAVGSKNMAYYLALVVNLENRSRNLSPLGIAKILSSKLVSAPTSNPSKTSYIDEQGSKNKNFNNIP